jgi:hypothetical protein
MLGTIKIDRKLPVKLEQPKGQRAVVTDLHLEGQGILFACLLAFYKDDSSEAAHKELFFHHPEYISAKHLPPRRDDFDISGFDHCIVKILTGSLHPEDEIVLSYSLNATPNSG